jgi:hypothetical protein
MSDWDDSSLDDGAPGDLEPLGLDDAEDEPTDDEDDWDDEEE